MEYELLKVLYTYILIIYPLVFSYTIVLMQRYVGETKLCMPCPHILKPGLENPGTGQADASWITPKSHHGPKITQVKVYTILGYECVNWSDMHLFLLVFHSRYILQSWIKGPVWKVPENIAARATV